MNKLIEAMVRPIDEDAAIVKEVLRLTEATADEWMGANNPDDWETDPAAFDDVMNRVRDRFTDERVKGFRHAGTGETVPPVPEEQAKERWLKAEPLFRKSLSKYNPEVQRRLRIFRRKGAGGATAAAAVCPHCGK